MPDEQRLHARLGHLERALHRRLSEIEKRLGLPSPRRREFVTITDPDQARETSTLERRRDPFDG